MNRDVFLCEYDRSFAKNGLERYISPELREKFADLTERFLAENERHNLTAIKDERGVIARHLIDCLTAVDAIPAGANVLDVGSGGGMPTFPFAICRPDVKITALDATAKKTAFIAETAKALKFPNISILTGRAEELGRDPAYRERYDVVCARAVARLNVLAEWCAPFLKTGGLFVALKGKNAEEELTEAAHAVKELGLSLVSADPITVFEGDEAFSRVNLIFRKISPISEKYPRSNTQIQKKPL